VNVATDPLALTLPGTPVPAEVTVNVVVFTVAGAIGSENVTRIVPVLEAPKLPAAGSIESTLGGVSSVVVVEGPVPESPQLRAAAANTPTWNNLPTRRQPTAGLVITCLPVMDRPCGLSFRNAQERRGPPHRAWLKNERLSRAPLV
jgi:hypothetical protein